MKLKYVSLIFISAILMSSCVVNALSLRIKNDTGKGIYISDPSEYGANIYGLWTMPKNFISPKFTADYIIKVKLIEPYNIDPKNITKSIYFGEVEYDVSDRTRGVHFHIEQAKDPNKITIKQYKDSKLKYEKTFNKSDAVLITLKPNGLIEASLDTK